MERIEGKIVDVHKREIFEGTVEVENGVITGIKRQPTAAKCYIIPGFIDSHVHIESSMLTPQHFGQLVITQGTVAVVTDPHEIANVLGVRGVEFMQENSKLSPIKTFFSIPSCVPATLFDASGGTVSADDTERLAATGRFVALSEVMNVPAVLAHDKEMTAKLDAAKKHSLLIDGHAPGLGGNDLAVYAGCGISADHECATLKEAVEKIGAGMDIQIREGSAAQNYEALKPLIKMYPDKVMFCTDDSHPDDLLELGHINKLVKRAIADGFDLFDVLKIASVNSINHYKLDVGQLRRGDKADFIVVDNLKTFDVEKVFINGVMQYDAALNDNSRQSSPEQITLNNFVHDNVDISAFKKPVSKTEKVISLIPDELLTTIYDYVPRVATGNLESDTENDIVKIVYINRYANGTPQVAFCKGFHLKHGAFGSSVAHDSHNIMAVGCNDGDLQRVVNAIIEHKGGLAVSDAGKTDILPLPIGGIMSNGYGVDVASDYRKICTRVREMGCGLHAPFMTLSFMSLLVIPEVKLGEKGLFSYSHFNWLSEIK
jgi:adenine deaminase